MSNAVAQGGVGVAGRAGVNGKKIEVQTGFESSHICVKNRLHFQLQQRKKINIHKYSS